MNLLSILRYHRLFLQGSKLDKLRKEFSQFWKQLKRGEEHTLLGSDTVSSCNTGNKDASNSVEGNSHRGSYGDEGLGSNCGDRNTGNSAVSAGDDRLGSESTISNSNHANNSCEGNNSIGNGADVPCSSNGHIIGGNGAINDSAGAEDNTDSNVASNSRSNTGDGSISIGVNDIKSSSSVTCPNQPINQTNLTSGVIEVKPKCTLGGHVACILSLLVTGKVKKFCQRIFSDFPIGLSIAHSPPLSTKSKKTRILDGYHRPGSDIVVANSVEFEVVLNIP